MILVTLVVVGHSWTLVPGISGAYDWLYLWHMPAFLVVTGYLSRRFRWTRRHLRRLLTTVVFPYVVFEGLFAIFRYKVGGEQLETLWLVPHWPMWFLAVLAGWRLVTPLLLRVPHPFVFSIAVSLLGGLVALDYLDGNRALGFLPFFVAGLVLGDDQLERLRSASARKVGLVVLAAGVLVVPWVEYGIGTEWVYYRLSYAELGVHPVEGILTRAALLTVGLAMSFSALAWIPRRGGWFSRLGAASLVVYLFHGFVVKGAAYAGFPAWADDHAVVAVVLDTVVAVALALLLSWRPVHQPLEKLVTPSP